MLTRLIGVAAALLLLGGAAWYLLGADGASGPGAAPGGGPRAGGGRGGPPRETLVVTRAVAEARAGDRVESLGDGEAAVSVTVVPRGAGTVTAVAVASGATVRAGDTIATLDAEAETIARDIAARGVEDATVERDRAARLVRSRAGARSDLDAAENALARAELALRDAALELARRTVTAPIEGRLGLVEIEPGDRVTAETPLVTIDDRRTLRIDFRVPERFAGTIEVGQPVSASSFALPGRTLDGRITAVGARVERDSRTLPVRASVDNAEDRLRPGMSFTVTLELAGEMLPAVDPLAIQWSSAGPFVWKVAAGEGGALAAARVPVGIVRRDPEAVLVNAELAPGDEVVTEGVLSLREGAAVRVAGAPRGGPGNGPGNGGAPDAAPGDGARTAGGGA